MRKLADENVPVTFALSLHAPDDELRDELIPVNSRWKVDEALDAARSYFEKTGRRVSIEYALIKDMNDHGWRADLLGDKLNARGRGWVHVNPIPLNPTPGSIWTASEVSVQNEFVRRATLAARRSTAHAASWWPPPTMSWSPRRLPSRRSRGIRRLLNSTAPAAWRPRAVDPTAPIALSNGQLSLPR
jgi:hypothetical protein